MSTNRRLSCTHQISRQLHIAYESIGVNDLFGRQGQVLVHILGQATLYAQRGAYRNGTVIFGVDKHCFHELFHSFETA